MSCRQLLFVGPLLMMMTMACSTLRPQAPTASVTDVEMGEASAQGVELRFGVRVTNPNQVALPLGAIDYRLTSGDAKLLDGKAKPENASVPAGGSTDVSLPLTVTFDNLLGIGQTVYRSGGVITYELDAGLTFEGGNPLLGGGPARAPLRYQGKLDLRPFLADPSIILRSPAARELARGLLGV